jgi:acetyltransferase-like isoleucine patch superfamily enzyme
MKFNNINIRISPLAKIGSNVKIGDNSVIYDNVVLKDNTIICNDCIIGEPTNDYYYNPSYVNSVTEIGENSLIRSHSIIYAGNKIGKNFSTGHRVTIREGNLIGDYCNVGTLSDLQGYIKMGNYCRLHSNVHIGQDSKIGNYVFLFPYVVLTNDPHPPSNLLKGATIGDYSVVAVHSVILPMVTIGKCCLVGANSTVSKDFEDESLIIGSPAKRLGSVKDVKSKEKINVAHYPWMLNFERGMPWQNEGYIEWIKTKK